MTVVGSKGQEIWSRRFARAGDLFERNPSAREVLRFYRRVLALQTMADRSVNVDASRLPKSPSEFRSVLDLEHAARSLPPLVSMVLEHGPSRLAADAIGWQHLSSGEVQVKLSQWFDAQNHSDIGFAFFPRVLLQPHAERLAQALGVPRGFAGDKCQVCGSAPQLAVIRPEGDGGKRSLLCWFCHTEWDFRRVLCPNCGEVNHEKLPRYTAEGVRAVRVEACDTCRTYLKSVDLTIDGHAVPLVDEIATAALDLWAEERGYQKIVPNIMGF